MNLNWYFISYYYWISSAMRNVISDCCFSVSSIILLGSMKEAMNFLVNPGAILSNFLLCQSTDPISSASLVIEGYMMWLADSSMISAVCWNTFKFCRMAWSSIFRVYLHQSSLWGLCTSSLGVSLFWCEFETLTHEWRLLWASLTTRTRSKQSSDCYFCDLYHPWKSIWVGTLFLINRI